MRNERKIILNRARRVEDEFVLNLSFESFGKNKPQWKPLEQ